MPVSPQYLTRLKDIDMAWSTCICDWGNSSKATLISTSKKTCFFNISIKDPIAESCAETFKK